MASNHTQNFNLNQWTLSDDVRMEDFNSDNTKLETALSGMMQCATGSYTGTGEYGAEHPNTLTFDFTPMLVIVTADDGNGAWSQMTAIRGSGTASVMVNYMFNSTAHVANTSIPSIWGDRSLTWYSSHNTSQSNNNTAVYHYVAMGCAATPV